MLSEETKQRLESLSKRPQTAGHHSQCGCHECVLVSQVKFLAKALLEHGKSK